MIALTVALILQAAPSAIVGPDADTLADVLSRPQLEHCNEIYCTHRMRQPVVIRDLDCAPTEEANVVLCRFQRAPAPLSVPVVLDALSEEQDAPIWIDGRAFLSRHPSGVWLLVSGRDADQSVK